MGFSLTLLIKLYEDNGIGGTVPKRFYCIWFKNCTTDGIKGSFGSCMAPGPQVPHPCTNTCQSLRSGACAWQQNYTSGARNVMHSHTHAHTRARPQLRARVAVPVRLSAPPSVCTEFKCGQSCKCGTETNIASVDTNTQNPHLGRKKNPNTFDFTA